MQLADKARVYALILLASGVFTVLAITFGYFPSLGLSISFILFTILAFYIKRERTFLTKIFFVITLALSLSLSIRSEGFLTVLNVLAVFYFGSLMVLVRKDASENIFSIAFAPLMLFLKGLLTPKEQGLEFKSLLTKEKKKEATLNTAAALSITLVTLAIILPLLSSANPYFEKLLSDVINFLGLKNLTLSEKLFEWLFRVIFFFALAFLVPRLATFINKKESRIFFTQEGFNMLLPKIAVAIVLAVFFVTQFQLYFSSSETLAALGYTYSNYANEVFAQLSAVAAIVVALLYSEKAEKKINKKMTLILLIEGIFLTLMAYKSVYEYINAWGFTYKRLYGFAVATWILGVFAIFLYTHLKNIRKNIFLIASVVFTGIILVLINVSNFDYIIYHFRPASTGQGVDYEYLSRLSSDSLSYEALLGEIVDESADSISELDKTKAEANSLRTLLFKIERLQRQYTDFDIREFNLLEYLQYRQIKDVDTEVIRDNYSLPAKSV